MSITYAHTNLIAEDWESLAQFYEKVFGCRRIAPVRDLQGEWLEEGTQIANAHLRGVHLCLPGHGENGPTLEIFSYDKMEEKLPAVANRKGYGHLAFRCDDVQAVREDVIAHGGKALGDVVSHQVQGAGLLTFCYMHDPEGNIVELQHWETFSPRKEAPTRSLKGSSASLDAVPVVLPSKE